MSDLGFLKTFDRYGDDAAPPPGTPAARGIWALRITRFDLGAKIGFAEDNLRAVHVLAHYRRRPGRGVESFEVYISGNLAFEYVTDPQDFDIFDGSLTPPSDLWATNTAVNELDSGPLAVAVGAAPTQIIQPNAARIRGVTVQNVGLSAIAVSKDPTLNQGGLAKGAYILNADTAVNAGNGGSVLFDGWTGGVWAVNVAGGPGSVLVSAF